MKFSSRQLARYLGTILRSTFGRFLFKKLSDFQMGSLGYVDAERETWTLRGRCRKVFEMQLSPHENTLRDSHGRLLRVYACMR